MDSSVTNISQTSPPAAMSIGRRSSSIASEMARHKAKLEAAKVREKYLQQKYEMERQIALLDLKVLQCKREIEEAQIEMNSLKHLDEASDEDFAEKEKEHQDVQKTAEES